MAIDKYQIYDADSEWSESWYEGKTCSGLGSSGSFFTAFIAGQAKINGIELSKYAIAEKAYYLEHELLGKTTGRQDHYAAVYGGCNLMEFGKGSVDITPYSKEESDRLASWIVLYNTGIQRKTNKTQDAFKKLTPEQIETLHKIKGLARKADTYIRAGKIAEVALILSEAWELKKKSNKVTNGEIDDLYNIAQRAGAVSGKLCGSGGGGYMFFMVNPEKREHFIKEMIEKTTLEAEAFTIDYKGLAIE